MTSYKKHEQYVSETLAFYDTLLRNRAGELIPNSRSRVGFSESQILTMAKAIAANRLRRKRTEFINNTDDARKAIQFFFGNPLSEHFCALWLDEDYSLIKAEIIFQGTIDGASVYPRVVVMNALKVGAKHVIIQHNHPSGTAIPSQSDIILTERIQKSLTLIGVSVLDHLIVGDTIFSFADNDLLK